MARTFMKGDAFTSTCIFTGGKQFYKVVQRKEDVLICDHSANEADGIHENQETFEIHKDGEREYVVLWEYKGTSARLYADDVNATLEEKYCLSPEDGKMEYKIVKRMIEGEEFYCMDITEEFVKRFGKCFAPIANVGIILGKVFDAENDAEMLEMLYKGIFSIPDYASISDDYNERIVTYGEDALLSGIGINVLFKNDEMLCISSEMMIASSLSEKESDMITHKTIQQANSEEPEVRKVAFTYGMSGDHMLILTDAPKSAIEDWIWEYLKGLEDNKNVYFKPLQKYYYVKVIADSEVNDLSWEDIEVIGFDESYDLGDYSVDENCKGGGMMSDRELAVILYNVQLDMDYGDAKSYGKQTVDMLEEEVAVLREKDSSLYHVLENIAMQNSKVAILIDGTEED